MNAHKLIHIGAVVVCLGTGIGMAASVDTAITYQGQLQQSGSPAQGAFDLRFTLYDSLEGGTQVGATLPADAVPIDNGLFTVNLDFGAVVFNGEARWLEIEVRTTEPAGVFTRLTPRQPLSPVPYAIQAASAGAVAADHITGKLTDAQLPSTIARLNADATFSGRVVATAFAGDGASLTGISSLDGLNGGAPDALQVNPNGLVGIGTPTPQAGLHLAAAKPSFQMPRKLAELAYAQNGSPIDRSVFVVDTMAYVLSREGLIQIDVSDPAQPGQVRLIQLPQSDPYDNWFLAARSLFVAGEYAYVTCGAYEDFGGTSHPSALVVVNLAITNKTIAHRLFDGQGGCNHLGGAAAVFVSGTTAYVTAQTDSALTILDVSAPASPQVLAALVDGQGGFNHLQGARAVYVSGSKAYVAAYGATDGKTRIPGALTILDVSDPRQPQLLAELVDGQGGFNHLTGARSIYVSGPNAFIGNQTVANGKIGIGTTSPAAKLHIESGTDNTPAILLSSESTGWGSGLQLENCAAATTWGMYTYAVDGSLCIGHDKFIGNVLRVFTNGTTTVAALDVAGSVTVAGTVTSPGFQGDGSKLANVAKLNGPNTFTGNQTVASGKLGIGTTSPNSKLHIESGNLNEAALVLSSSSRGWGSGLMLENSSGGTVNTWGLYTYEDGTFCLGNVEQPKSFLTVTKDGTTTVNVLQILGGSDIAEPFRVSTPNETRPGHVVCIDPQQPGALRLSTKAYDPTVAGIVSGANGIQCGMMLRQEETVADGTHPVALTGRVWCYCDADAAGPIHPGDLLTTADTPGHAMKVSDRERAYGAIIGKAMSSLKQGQGLVLVLVSLQ